MKKANSRIVVCLLAFAMLVSIMAVSAFAESADASLLTEFANGDKVVIYYPDSSLALGNTLSGNKLAAVDAIVADNKLTVTTEMGIFTLTLDNDKNAYYLVDANGKYLTSGQTGNSVSLADEASDLALWSFEAAENGYYFKNYAAVYGTGETAKPQYLEYYSGFTTYSFNASKANIYTFAFYKVTDDVVPEAPSEDESSAEESSEAESSADEVVFSTIADARKGENNTVFNVKGVVTFVDGKNVVVADETGAINLYLSAVAEVSVGNKIAAKGKRGAFSGLQQLTSASVLEVLEESAILPAFPTTTIEQILADTEAETLECHFVRLENVTLGETNAEKTTTAITDDAGNSINIYRCPELDIAVGTKINVVALVSDYNGYQLRVADASAITVADVSEESSEESVESEASEEISVETSEEASAEASEEASVEASAEASEEASVETSEEASVEASEESKEETAKPGDSSTLALFVVISLVSMTALVAFVKRENA